jgi:signal transduction histidine kinase
MQRQGPLTFRHMLVAVLVIVLVNAQLTWWIVFALRENRARLDLERQQLSRELELQRTRIAFELSRIENLVLNAQNQRALRADDLQPPFVSLTTIPIAECDPGWEIADSELEFVTAENGGCRALSVDSEWLSELLEVGESLTLAQDPDPDVDESESFSVPSLKLHPPFADRRLRPTSEVWNAVLGDYRSRILMMVTEGAFFAVMLLFVIGLLWKTMRREVELERRHRNFLSAITHELKSPLAAMRLSLETVLRGRADASASTRFLENALQDTERLQSLVQKVLEVTRFSGGNEALRRRSENLSEVIEDGIEAFSHRATTAGAIIEARIRPGVRARIDREAISIVLSNLLENALKYGGTLPKIGIKLERLNGKLVLEVSDNGRGMPNEELPFIFERFYRCGDEMTRTTHGTGLGLFLVKEIVQAHGGTVSVAETGSEGSTFRVVLTEADRWEETR